MTFIAISHDGSTAYAPDAANNVIYAIRTSDFVVTGTVPDPHTILQAPEYIAMSPDGTKAYISNVSSGHYSVGILDVADNMITGSVTGAFNRPVGIAFTPDGSIAYVANTLGASVNVVDVVRDVVLSTLTGSFNHPSYIATTTSSIETKSYVANALGNSVSIIVNNTVTGSVGGIFTSPNGIAITQNGATAYVANSANRVNIVDVTTNVVTGTVSGGTFALPYFIAITPDGRTAYVSNTVINTVSIIDLATNAVTGTVSVGNNPQGLTITPNGQQVWVVNQFANTISIIGYAISNLVNLQGCQIRQVVLGQTNLINILTWQPPITGTPVSYIIYRDALLTDVAGTVLATAHPLQFVDHSRKPGVTYTYYIIAVDASGNTSAASVIPVTQACTKK